MAPGRKNMSHGGPRGGAAARSRRASDLHDRRITAGEIGDRRRVIMRAAIGQQHLG